MAHKSLFFFISFIFTVSCKKDNFIPVSYRVVEGLVMRCDNHAAIAGATVSDGITVVYTDESGFFSFKTEDDTRFVFVSVPSWYEIPQIDGVPTIFKELDLWKDTVQLEFCLKASTDKNEEFAFFVFADPQVRDGNTFRRFMNESISDVSNFKNNYSNFFGFVLGDLVHDDTAFFPQMKEAFVSTGIPFFYVVGNHDYDQHTNIHLSSNAFENEFGPLDYSFNRGGVHFVVLNSVIYKGEGRYSSGFTDAQIDWLRTDLDRVDKETLLVILTHVPINANEGFYNSLGFHRLIGQYSNVQIINGHKHFNVNSVSSTGRYRQHIVGAVSGAWWDGNLNRCGTPIGYGVYTVRNKKIRNVLYKSCFDPITTQMSLYVEESFFYKGDRIFIANVWNANEHWNISVYADGVKKGEMKQFFGYDIDRGSLNMEKGRSAKDGFYASPTNHLFYYNLEEPVSVVEALAQDEFGNIFRSSLNLKE